MVIVDSSSVKDMFEYIQLVSFDYYLIRWYLLDISIESTKRKEEAGECNIIRN